MSMVHHRETQILLADFKKAQEVLRDKITALQILWVLRDGVRCVSFFSFPPCADVVRRPFFCPTSRLRVQAAGDGGEAPKQRESTRRPACYRGAPRDGHRKRRSGEEAGGESWNSSNRLSEPWMFRVSSSVKCCCFFSHRTTRSSTS